MEDHTETISSRTRAAQILKLVLAEELSIEQALALWPSEENYEDDPILGEAYHALQHYAADEDLREWDSDYAQEQREELQEIVQRLIFPLRNDAHQEPLYGLLPWGYELRSN
jgi:hypothetical protein